MTKKADDGMPCCLGRVQIIRNEGTIIFGNIKQYSPSMNETSTSGSGSEQTDVAGKTAEAEAAAGVSNRRKMRRQNRRLGSSCAKLGSRSAKAKKGPAATGSGPKVLYYKKGGRLSLYAPFIKA
jgi:hypothetical protein